jgi:high-affinity iron transporter
LASLGAFGAKPALASPPAKTWLARVPQIELKLKQAMGEYKKAQVAQAKRLLDDAYFGVFENVKANMEVAIRREIGLKRVSEIEGNIGEIRRGFSKGEDSAKIEAVLRELMTQIKESASELDAQKVAVK